MMKLLYVHNIAMPGPEANTVNVAKMSDAFAAEGCDVTLAALPGANTGSAFRRALIEHYGLKHEFKVVALPRMCARPTLAAATGAWIAALRRPDIVYTRAPHVAWASCRLGLPTALEIHADFSGFSSLGARVLRRVLASKSLLAAVVISRALAERLSDAIGASAPHFLVAHGGAEEAARPSQLPLPAHHRFAIGFVGRFYRGRGLELIAQLCAACPWADFHVAGGSELALAELIGDIPANMIVHGSLPHSDVAELMQRCDALIAPYQRAVYVADGRTDTAAWMSPLKVFEYMAAGKAIVASDLPAIREVLSHGETALLCNPDEPRAWSAALERLRDNADLRARLGARAALELNAHYTWRARARAILDFCSRPPARQTRPAMAVEESL